MVVVLSECRQVLLPTILQHTQVLLENQEDLEESTSVLCDVMHILWLHETVSVYQSALCHLSVSLPHTMYVLLPPATQLSAFFYILVTFCILYDFSAVVTMYRLDTSNQI